MHVKHNCSGSGSEICSRNHCSVRGLQGSKVSRVVKARDMSPMDQKSSFEPRSFSLLLVVLSTPPDFYFWAGTHA